MYRLLLFILFTNHFTPTSGVVFTTHAREIGIGVTFDLGNSIHDTCTPVPAAVVRG